MDDPEAEDMEANGYLRETIMSLHRASMNKDERVRLASLNSLVEMASDGELGPLVVQTWLEQFARVNGGNGEYCGNDRVRLLRSMMTIADNLMSNGNASNDSNAFRAAVGRTVSLAVEEMTRTSEVVEAVQKPCSKILVRLGSKRHVDKVMDAVLSKFQPGAASHFYVLTTLSELATSNPSHVVPFLKAILGTMLANMKSVKKDQLRFAYANAFSRFSEAILDYLANIEAAPDQSVTKEHFVTEIDSAHEILFNIWLNGKGMSLTPKFEAGSKVKNAVIEALGFMAPLLSDERLYRNAASPVCSTLLGLYKKVPEPFYLTQCVCNLLKAMLDRDIQLIDGIAEPLFTALFVQVCQFSASSSDLDSKRRNHYEVLRTYDLLVRSHTDKLVTGLMLRLNSVDENIRVSALIVFKHLLNSSMDVLASKMTDLLNSLHSRLAETSNRVRKMLAQIVALVASLGYLEGEKGQDFLEFIVKLCALPDQPQDGGHQASEYILNYLTSDYNGGSVVTNSSLKDMCDNILMLLTKEAMEAVLWPKLVDYLLAPDYTEAVPSLIKSLAALCSKANFGQEIDYEKLKFLKGPYDLLARLIVLASVPEKAEHVLGFMLSISGLINKHLSALWAQRIPLLQHYLENTKIKASQEQWEEWLLGLLDDTLAEVDLDEWTVAFAASLTLQIGLYPEEDSMRKNFLFKALGRALKKAKASNRVIIGEHLNSVFKATNHDDEEQSEACALTFGHAASAHLGLVLERLETLLKSEFGRRSTSFFGFMRADTKSEDCSQRCTILKAVGATRLASKADLEVKADEMCQKFIMPAMQSTSGGLKMAALKATSDIASALNGLQDFRLAHHSDLIHEAIECMKAKSWSLAEKHVALITTLELVKLPPFVSQLTRCSILKACFTAVFPNLIRQPPNEAVEAVLTKMLSLVQALLLQELRQSTLDEIFTLLEPYLKLAEKTSRQMAMTILHATLKTFLTEQKANEVEEESSFAPGPYIMGSLVPRCFDPSIWVTSTALASLKVIVQISQQFLSDESHSNGLDLEEDLEAALVALDRISASCSPLTVSSFRKMNNSDIDILDDPEVSPGLVASTIVNILKLILTPNELLPLLHSLIDGLGDECSASARGVSLVLTSLLEVRGREVTATTSLLTKLHARLASPMQEDTRGQSLMAVRILTSHNPREVIEAVLNDHKLPFDEPLAEMWRALTKEKSLAEFILCHLLDNLKPEALIIEEKDKITFRTKKVAGHKPLASIHALKICLEVKEMEAIVDHAEFADVFVPLIMAMASYSASEVVLAEAAASDALKAFLASKGCQSAANIVEAKSDDGEFVSSLTEAICVDFPMYLPKLASAFKVYSSMRNEHLVVAASFYAQLILTTEAVLDLGLQEVAVSSLLEYLRGHREGHAELRIMCLSGLSGLSLDPKKASVLSQFSTSVLRAVMDTIGDDFEAEDVNFHALSALEHLIDSLTSEVMTSDLATSIVTKISPFFDGGRKRDAAAAMKVFSKLASFSQRAASEAERGHFSGLVHQVMVSLLLHLNGEDEERSEASKVAITNSLGFFAASPASTASLLLLGKRPSFNYSEFLRDFCRHSIGCDEADMYVDRALSYLRISEARLRGNAALLLTSLIVEGHGAEYGRNHSEVICASLSRLLADGIPEVQAVAASSLGKVCIALSKLPN